MVPCNDLDHEALCGFFIGDFRRSWCLRRKLFVKKLEDKCQSYVLYLGKVCITSQNSWFPTFRFSPSLASSSTSSSRMGSRRLCHCFASAASNSSRRACMAFLASTYQVPFGWAGAKVAASWTARRYKSCAYPRSFSAGQPCGQRIYILCWESLQPWSRTARCRTMLDLQVRCLGLRQALAQR